LETNLSVFISHFFLPPLFLFFFFSDSCFYRIFSFIVVFCFSFPAVICVCFLRFETLFDHFVRPAPQTNPPPPLMRSYFYFLFLYFMYPHGPFPFWSIFFLPLVFFSPVFLFFQCRSLFFFFFPIGFFFSPEFSTPIVGHGRSFSLQDFFSSLIPCFFPSSTPPCLRYPPSPFVIFFF